VNVPNVADHKKRKRRGWHIRLTRDLVIFGTGILGILHEVFLSTSDRPTLIILFGAMIGLPAFLRLDAKDNKKEDE
jgi:hypothetical protein